MGHFCFGIHSHLPGVSEYITMLRQPADRLLSLYRYSRDNSEAHYHFAAKEKSFEEFITCGWVLETDNGSYLSECIAICRYLEALHPEPPLFGTDAETEAQVLMWNSICEQEGLPSVAEMLRNWSPGFRNRVFPGPAEFEQIPELIERGRRRIEQFYDRIEAQLAKHPYLAGEFFSFADITLFATAEFTTWVEIDPREERPALAAWVEKFAARPAAGA